MEQRQWWVRMAGYGFALCVFTIAGAAGAQQPCFRTAAEAAVQAAPAEGALSMASAGIDQGFRLERVRRDPLRGDSWATVAWCGHPERPELVVRVAGSAAQTARSAEATKHAPWAILAGNFVTVVWAESLVRMQAPGVATRSAAIGDRLKVRLGEQSMVEGTVRDGQTIEIE